MPTTLIPFDLTQSTGSAKHKYSPTKCELKQCDPAFYVDITAMEEYSKVSAEELRCEDYIASNGLFGSNIANLCEALFVDPNFKPSPHVLGIIFHSTAARCQLKANFGDTMAEQTETKENGAEEETVRMTDLPDGNRADQDNTLPAVLDETLDETLKLYSATWTPLLLSTVLDEPLKFCRATSTPSAWTTVEFPDVTSEWFDVSE